MCVFNFMRGEKFVKKSPYTNELEDLSMAMEGPKNYWYKEFEIENPRDRQFPRDRAMEEMYLKNLKQPTLDYLTANQKVRTEAIWKKQEEIAKRIFDAEFWRPRKAIFDPLGKFTSTRVDEQSWL